MNRRSFLQACLAAAAAPYVVTSAGVLMPVRSRDIWTLTESNLEAMLIEIGKLTDDRGLKIQILPRALVLRSTALHNWATQDHKALRSWCERVISQKRPTMCGLGYTTDYNFWKDNER